MGREAKARRARKEDSQRLADLERENEHLRRNNASLVELTKQAQEEEKIVVMVGAGEPPDGVTALYSESYAAQRAKHILDHYRDAMMRDFVEIIDFTAVYRRFELLMMKIDAIALYSTRADLPDRLEGLDSELAGAFIDVRKYLLNQMKAPDQAQALAGLVHERIEGIRLVKQDNGEYLRAEVLATNKLFSDTSEQVMNRARQGRRKSPTVSRIVEYADQLRADPHMTWNDAARELKKQLEQRQHAGERLDKEDAEILHELTWRHADSAAQDIGVWLKNTVHTRRRATRGKGA